MLGRGFVRAMLRAWLLVGPLVLVQSAVRLVQLMHFWPDGFGASRQDVAAVLWQGVRFDLKVAAVLVFVLLLLWPWLTERIYRIVAAVVLGFVVVLSVINLHYFGFYKTPIDSLVFGVFEDDTGAVFATIWRDFPVALTLLGTAALIAAGIALHGRLVRQTAVDKWLHPGQTGRLWVQCVLALVSLVALLFAGKGTVREMALQKQHLTVTTSQFLNDMVPNGAIALKYAWDSRRQSQQLNDPLLGLRAMGYQTAQEAAKVLGLPADDEAAVQAALYQHPALPANTPKKNLIFFLMESWSAEPMLYQSARFDVLGRMAPTLQDACHFDNFDSAQPGTHPSLEAILFSSPITPLTLGDAGRKPLPSSIAIAAQKAGYHTLFLTAGRSGWRDLNRVLKTQGFDEVVDANTLREMYPEANVGLWGVWDEYIFKYLQHRMAQQPKPGDKPLMVFVLSVTNHPPYDLPENYTPPKLDMAQWKGETSADTLVPNLDTYRYSADLLGGFVQWLRGTPWWDNTILAGTGDHNVRSFGVYAEASRRYLIRQVPFVIWGKNLQCGTQQHLPASHRDMFPTLFPLVGVDAGYVQTGRNLLAAPTASPMDAPRTLFYTAESRNAQGAWQLGNPASFVCTSAKQSGDVPGCAFNPQDDAQERARIGLLDWNIRYGLQHRK